MSELSRFEHDRLTKVDSDGFRSWHEFSLCQNGMSALDVRGHNGDSKIDRKQASPPFKGLHLAIGRPRTFWIENQIAVSLMQKLLTHRQTPPQRVVSCVAINRYDIHKSGD